MKKIFKIGEKINSNLTVKMEDSQFEIKELLKKKEKQKLQQLAKLQVEEGVDALDVHVSIGKLEEEPFLMAWLVDILQEVIDVPLCLDTDHPFIMEAGLKQCKKKALVNSITGERKRLDSFLPLIQQFDADCIALALGGTRIPSHFSERVENCKRILEEAKRYGITEERIFFDPIVTALGADINGPKTTLHTLKGIKAEIPKVKTILGLSNVSYGLPKGKLLNHVFLEMSLPFIDAVILDPLDKELMNFLKTGKMSFSKKEIGITQKALKGEEEGYEEYITEFGEPVDFEDLEKIMEEEV